MLESTWKWCELAAGNKSLINQTYPECLLALTLTLSRVLLPSLILLAIWSLICGRLRAASSRLLCLLLTLDGTTLSALAAWVELLCAIVEFLSTVIASSAAILAHWGNKSVLDGNLVDSTSIIREKHSLLNRPHSHSLLRLSHLLVNATSHALLALRWAHELRLWHILINWLHHHDWLVPYWSCTSCWFTEQNTHTKISKVSLPA